MADVARTSLAKTLGCGTLAAAVQAAVVLPFLGRQRWDRDALYFSSADHRP